MGSKLKRGNLDGAIADYSEALKTDPRDANAYNYRGVARYVTGDLDAATADYTKAIEIDPQYARA